MILLPFPDSCISLRSEYAVSVSACISVKIQKHLPIPDIFVPIDTTRASDFYIACNKKATPMRFASAMFDRYKATLSPVDDFDQLGKVLDRMDIPTKFREYASRVDGIPCTQSEWEKTEEYLLPQLRALIGRYSRLGEDAFYKMYLGVDTTVRKAIESD